VHKSVRSAVYYCNYCCYVDAYSDRHIVYKWKEGPRKSVGIDLSVHLPQFSIRGYRAKNKLEVLSTGMIYQRLVECVSSIQSVYDNVLCLCVCVCCVFFILRMCCIIVTRWTGPGGIEASSFNALTLLVGSLGHLTRKNPSPT